MQDLFPNNFLAAIDRLSLSISQVPARVAAGQHLSARAGPSLQFRDFKGYSEGDDLRRIDWNVYSRTRHLFVRRFDQPTAIPVTLLLDGSVSMHLEQPSRYATGARLAAAVASAAMSAQNPVKLCIADRDGGLTSSSAGRSGLLQILATLAADRFPSELGVSSAIQSLLPKLSRKSRGVLVVISDFFDVRGVEAIIQALQQYAGRIVCLRVIQPWDAEPDLEGELELIDCETNARIHASVEAGASQRYQLAYEGYFAKLGDYLRNRGGRQAVFDASLPTSSQLERIFPNGVLTL